jgi:tetratricopeptide (TPR) repeat protein
MNNLGLLYHKKEDYNKALDYYEKILAMEIKKKGKHTIDVADILNNIGGVYYSKEDYVKALEYYEKSLEIMTKLKGNKSIDVA